MHPVQDPQERRLAAARGPDQRGDLAGGHGQRDPVEHLALPEPRGDVARLQGGERRGGHGGEGGRSSTAVRSPSRRRVRDFMGFRFGGSRTGAVGRPSGTGVTAGSLLALIVT